jgi:deoxyribonuclease-4
LNLYGSHLSIAKGMHAAVTRAGELAMTSVQVFTKNQQQWRVPPLTDEAVAAWTAERRRLEMDVTVSHGSYLINLASPDEALWNKGIDLFIEEVRRCDLLGIPFLVTHPGAHMGSGDETGIARVAAALDRVYAALPDAKTITCLESTAGQGTTLGHRLGQLADIIAKAARPDRLGVCLDTAHLFAAGYDFRKRKYSAFCQEIESTVGCDRVRVWHLNDSKKPLGSRVDRHEHIGLGEIGDDGFRPIVRDKRWRAVPKILETPKPDRDDGRAWDTINLERLRGLE